MICPKCRFEHPDGSPECPKCGLIFAKFVAGRRTSGPHGSQSRKGPETIPFGPRLRDGLKDLFFHDGGEVSGLYFGGRVLLFTVLLIYCAAYLLSSVETSHRVMPFMHLVNLPFHEAGHIIFRPFGRFAMFLGGTFGQLMIPFICMWAFLITTRNIFGGAVCLWWTAQNFVDIAPYINDARALRLILLGGVTGRETDGHDWENMLRTLGWLKYDHLMAKAAYGIGIVLMFTALAWGGYILVRQLKTLIEKE